MALGYPLGLSKVITRGIVSSVEDTYVLFDAPISSGNSGGPVVNQFGEVIGVATMGSNSRSGTVVQNLNVGIRVTAIPSLGLFADPLLRISAVAARIREVEAFIEEGYRKNNYFALCGLLVGQMWLTHLQREQLAEWERITKTEEGKKGLGELRATTKEFEDAYGSLTKAVEHYVAFLKECEARIDRLPATFLGLGDDPVLRDFLKDERRGGWIRVSATPGLLPELARISADHWLARLEDHRFRLEWALHYSGNIPVGPPLFSELRKLDSDETERPRVRLRYSVTNDYAIDLKHYLETIKRWDSRKEVYEDLAKQFRKNGSAEKDPIKAETMHGVLLSSVSGFRMYLAIEAAENADFDAAIALLRADIGNRASSCWSGALLAQQLVYAGRFDEAWLAYERHFAEPPPFDAFGVKQGWSDGGASIAQFHVCDGMNIDGAGFREQFSRFPQVIANAEKWNELVKTVAGRRMESLQPLKETLLSEWFQGLARFSRIRVLSYFRYVRPDEQRMIYFRKHGRFPPLDASHEQKDFDAALAASPESHKLWSEISGRKEINGLF